MDEHKQLIINNLSLAIGRTFNPLWLDLVCQGQTELECGPRALWAMVMLCCGHRKNVNREEIVNKIANLGGVERALAAETIRREIAAFGGGSLDVIGSNRLWS